MAIINELPNGITLVADTRRYNNITIGANTYQSFNVDIRKEGYTPRALLGYYTTNSDSGGQNTSFVLFSAVYIEQNLESIFVRLRNVYSSSAKVDFIANILYEKD